MSKVTIKDIKELRQATGGGVMEVKKALLTAKGDMGKAKQVLKKQGLTKIAKRADKKTPEGQVLAYVHQGGQLGAMIKIGCETDFVAKGDDFQKLTKELAMQVASMNPKNVKELLGQEYIRDHSKKIEDLIKETSIKVKEKIEVKEIVRLEI